MSMSWRELEVDGKQQLACTVTDAARYLGMSAHTVAIMLADMQIPVYEVPYGTPGRLILRGDLDEIKKTLENLAPLKREMLVPKKEKRTIEDIEWVVLDMPDGTKEQACSIRDVAPYLDVNYAAVTNILKKKHVKKWERDYGTERFVLKKDLDELKRVRPAE